jgi:2,3-bisphosphoglycerate-dependent phosphoglycerate mutase
MAGQDWTTARLLMVRHAAPAEEWQAEARLCGWYDPPLGARGRQQAEAAAERLAGESEATVVYASPLRRAWQTAEVIAARLALPLVALADVREVHCGALDGVPFDVVRGRHPELWARNDAQHDDSFRWPGGESYTEFRGRVRRAVDRIAARHAPGDALVVTHTGVITQALGMLHGWGAARWDRGRPAHAAIVEVDWSVQLRVRVVA